MKTKVLSFCSLESTLALNQTQGVIDLLQERLPRLTCQLNILASPVSVHSKRDEPFLAASRREVEFLEKVLLDEQARLAVIEAADMVLPLPEGLAMICVPDRNPPYDAFLNRQGLIMDEMEPGSRIGVLSLRSRAQMQALWPELKFKILRGGVDRAMETHLQHSEIEGLVLPAAVTEYLGIQGIVAEIFAPEFILPGPGQGTLVIVGRSEDQEARELLAEIHSEATEFELIAEQAFCSRMVSDQDLPVGALARTDRGGVVIEGATGKGINRISVSGKTQEAEAIGFGLAQQILSSTEAFADLLEADFPDGLPDDPDEDAALLDDLDETSDDDLAAGDDIVVIDDDLDDLEHMRHLESLAGIEDAGNKPRRSDPDPEDI